MVDRFLIFMENWVHVGRLVFISISTELASIEWGCPAIRDVTVAGTFTFYLIIYMIDTPCTPIHLCKMSQKVSLHFMMLRLFNIFGVYVSSLIFLFIRAFQWISKYFITVVHWIFLAVIVQPTVF